MLMTGGVSQAEFLHGGQDMYKLKFRTRTRITALAEANAVIQFYSRRGRSALIKQFTSFSAFPQISSSDSSLISKAPFRL
jgi:hypothetical protein